MASLTLTVRDETTSGDVLAALELQLEAERVSVRELIRARVHQEVRAHNASSGEHFHGLVRPTDAEEDLNGYRMRRGRQVDAGRQTEVALSAFERGHVLLLVDDRQVDDLNDEVTLTLDSTVTFLRLVPLVGG